MCLLSHAVNMFILKSTVRRRNERRGNPAIRLPGSDISDFGSGLDDGDDDGGVFRRLSDSPPELSLSDL